MEGELEYFQGVLCCSMDSDRTVKDTIMKLLDLDTSSVHHGVPCLDLQLKNKYYQATVHLFDYEQLDDKAKHDGTVLKDCHAIILCADGQRLVTDRLDEKVRLFGSVAGEPRILLFDGINEDCETYRGLQAWCIKNGYDFINTSDECAQSELVDSLSAYRWTHRDSIDRKDENNSENDKPQLDEEVIKKLTDFDTLLNKLSAYRDRPELRGDPNDENIVEIAEILSGLLGDDLDDFLDNDDIIGSINNKSSGNSVD